MTIQKAVDQNQTPYDWYCHSGLHLWIGQESAELCCDGIHERILKTVSLEPHHVEFEWVVKGEGK